MPTTSPSAGLTQFAPTEASRTLDGEAGRSLLTVLLMNEGRAQFLAEMGEDPPTEAEIEDVYATLGADHPLQTLTGDTRAAVAYDTIYTQRLDAIEVTDVETLRERYEAPPASLGVYCATAVVLADQADAEAVAAAIAGGATAEDAAATFDANVTDWQCTPISTVTDPVLHASLVAAQPGEAIGPVSTADGFAVLVIDTWDDAAPEAGELLPAVGGRWRDVRRLRALSGIPARRRHRGQPAVWTVGPADRLRRHPRNVTTPLRSPATQAAAGHSLAGARSLALRDVLQ